MHIDSELSTQKLLAASRNKAALAVLFSCIFTSVFLCVVSSHFSSEITTMRQTQLLQRVEIAKGAISPILQKIREGQITTDAGLQTAIPLIRRMIFSDAKGSNYFFIISFDGGMLLQPFQPYLENAEPSSLEYKINRDTIHVILSAAHQSPGGCFVQYSFSHPNTPGLQEKESYVVTIPELGVVLGSGIYSFDSPLSSGQLILFSGGIILLLAVIIPFFICMKKSNNQIITLSETVRSLQQQETALKDIDHKYHTILDNSIEGIVILQNHSIRLANHAFCNFTGYSKNELYSLSLDTLIHPDDIRTITENHRRLRTDEYFSPKSTFRLLEKNGSVRWILTNSSSIMWQNEPATLSIMFDLTNLKTTQEELRAEQSRFRYFMENAPFPIAVFSQNGYLKHVNKRCTAMWGIDASTLVNTYNMLTDVQLQHEPVRSQIRRAFAGETITTMTIPYDSAKHTSPGVVHHVTFRFYPAFHGDGKLKDVILVHDDVTDDKVNTSPFACPPEPI